MAVPPDGENATVTNAESRRASKAPARRKSQSENAAPQADPLDTLVGRVREAQRQYANFDQAAVDRIFRDAAMAAASQRIRLAKAAATETGMGVVEDKVIKNHFAAEYIYNQYRDTPTCGVAEDDPGAGFRRLYEPIGLIAAVVPTTNPTSTAIFKCLLALKTRNGVVVSPHPRARRSTAEAVRIVHEAAVAAGAPEGILGCLEEPTVESATALMHHPEINMILATGGPAMVRAAYSSGKPAIGVGAGNTPVIIDERADIKMAVSSVLMSKTFDNSMICASEQALIVTKAAEDAVRKELVRRGALFVTGKDREKLATALNDGHDHVTATVVGQPASIIAERAGFEVPADTKVLLVDCREVGENEIFSREKLCPVLAFYSVPDFDAALETGRQILLFGGAGHTSVLYTDEGQADRIAAFQDTMVTGRILINMPSSLGAIGDVYNFRLAPSLTLGCGSWGGNSVSENIGVKHLLNVKTVAARRTHMQWYQVPPKIYFDTGALEQALKELKGRKRAFVITDPTMEQLGHVRRVGDLLESVGISWRVYAGVRPDPDISNVREALGELQGFEPDVLVALGGGSPMDAAKIAWLMYEHQETEFEEIALRFMDIRKRICTFPELGRRAIMVAIPTTSGSGSEVTPFAVVTDQETGVKYPIADYQLTPDVAIVDPNLVMTLPATLAAHTGLDVLTHGIESFTSIFSSNMTEGQALEAVRLTFKYLPRSVKHGAADPTARSKMHYAATIAGMSFANAFLGICHSMAHQFGAAFHLPHGLANALLISHVIRYNATDRPTKMGVMPQYRYPFVKGRFARIADYCGLSEGLGADDVDAKIERLIGAIETLKTDLGTPASLREAGISEPAFLSVVDELAEQAFDDQCTPTGARYPLIGEIRQIMSDCFYGVDPLTGQRRPRAVQAETA